MKIELISGVEGECITVNDTRIAGPKPWGGGKVLKTWNVDPYGIYAIAKECNKELEEIRHKRIKDYAEKYVAEHYFI